VQDKNLEKTYFTEIKTVSLSSAAKVRGKKGGERMKVSLAMLMKTNVEKMSDFRSLAM